MKEIGKWWASFTASEGKWEVVRKTPQYEIKLGPYDSFGMAKGALMAQLFKLRQKPWMREAKKFKQDGVAALEEGLGER